MQRPCNDILHGNAAGITRTDSGAYNPSSCNTLHAHDVINDVS